MENSAFTADHFHTTYNNVKVPLTAHSLKIRMVTISLQGFRIINFLMEAC